MPNYTEILQHIAELEEKMEQQRATLQELKLSIKIAMAVQSLGEDPKQIQGYHREYVRKFTRPDGSIRYRPKVGAIGKLILVVDYVTMKDGHKVIPREPVEV